MPACSEDERSGCASQAGRTAPRRGGAALLRPMETTSWQSPSGQMSEEQWWAFDTRGFLVVRDALPPEALLQLRMEPAVAADVLQSIPAIKRYLIQLCGDSPQVSSSGTNDFGDSSVLGGNEGRSPELRRDAYYNIGQAAGGRLVSCGRLVAICAIEDADSALDLVPASHNSLFPPPATLLDGSDRTAFYSQPLRAADLLLVSGATLHSFQSSAAFSLVMCSFCSGSAPPPKIEQGAADMPQWMAQLTKPQQLLLWPYRTVSESPAPVVLSDGHRNWLGTSHSAGAHRALFNPDPHSLIDQAEMWSFDCNGYLVLKGIMDTEWLTEARAAINANIDRVFLRGDGHDGDSSLAQRHGALAGTGRPDLTGLFELPAPHNAPFLKMLDHPAIIHRLNW